MAPHIPDRATCLALLERYGAYPNIRRHCRQVAGVALQIARARNRSGSRLDLRLVEAAALLHDIGKVRELESDRRLDHVKEGVEILRREGLHEIARVVAVHLITDYVDGDLDELSRVVNYADKRVLHDRVVSLAERMEYIRSRYRFGSPEIFRAYARIEKELLGETDLDPEEVREEPLNQQPAPTEGSRALPRD